MMNDCYKFRVYSNIGQNYIDEERLKYFFIGADGELYLQRKDESVLPINQEQYIVEFYTGLPDKNGKLIYKGDIFKAIVINSFPDDKCLNKTIIGQVSYFAKECMFAFSSYSPINLSEIEIIGNIHENPEFLEQSNLIKVEK